MSTTEIEDEDIEEHDRERRHGRRRRRSQMGFAARPVCLSCLVMAILWLASFGYGFPGWAVAAGLAAMVVMLGVGALAWRGRTVSGGIS
jgi:hypothetical protein